MTFSFVLGLQILKVILSNTASQSKYLQEKQVDVINAKNTATATTATLSTCRNDEHFENVWKVAEPSANRVIAGPYTLWS